MTSHHKIIELHEMAKRQGGKCLSTTYVNNRTKLIWECSKGHLWKAAPKSIKGGSWCPVCYGNMRHTIDMMRKLADWRGGKCLSNTYKNNSTKLMWECSLGHRWEASPRGVISGNWCPDCAGNHKLTIDEMHELAEESGGRCLSNTYVNNKTKLIWECSYGHQWEATPKNIKQGTWCPACFFSRLSTLNANKHTGSTMRD